MSEPYRLIYWPMLQGRGEFIRLILEDADLPYVDVARLDESEGGGVPAVLRYIRGEVEGALPYAPPILESGALRIAQTSNIAMYLATTHQFPGVEDPWHLNQMALTIADIVAEAHDTHHPIAKGKYFEDQKAEAIENARWFVVDRMPKLLGYFERVIERSGGPFVTGSACTYVDLWLFQVVEGLRYAFERGFEGLTPKIARVIAVRDRVAERPRVAAYLASERRIEFNADGIFRRYPELDHAPA